MTNNEIIFENVRASFTPAQLAELVQATYTAEQIAARRANITITVDEGSADTAEDIFTAMLAADQFHTFAEWKRMGYSVKKGAKSAITCQLWKYTDKPGKAAREAAEAAGKDAPETDPHFYMAKAHLFHALQVETPSVDPAQADTLAGLHRTKQPSPRSKTQKQDQEEHKMKFTGRYTAATAKALKGSPRLVCQVTEDGTIYVCNGFLLCTMNPPEYAATVQGFTCCEPGNWTLDKDGKHEDDAHKLDLVRLYADTLKANADAQPLQRSPLTVQTPKAAAVCYYNAAADFAAIYDTKFIAALHPAAQLRTTSAISAAVAYCDDEPFAVVMPIKAEPETVRAVRAFFTEAAEDNAKTGEADKLRAELAQSQEEAATLRGDLYRAANEIDELKNKLAELHETKTEQPAAEAVEPKTAAEIIAARWAEVDGLTATIKGATTAAPVVWLAGDTKPHEKEIEAAGGKWSGKKNAYYFRVA